MSKSLAGVAYSAVRAVQEVGQKGGQIARTGKLRCRCVFARTQAFKHAWRGIFCSARSPGGRAGRRKNCEKNPANCAAAVFSRARRRLSMRGAAYSAGRAVQEVGQEAGKIASKIQQTAQPLCFRARAGVSAWVFGHKKENQRVTAEHRLLWLRHGCS